LTSVICFHFHSRALLFALFNYSDLFFVGHH
jgi:hypothetical protein